VCGEELKTRVRLGVLVDNAIAKLIQQMHPPKGTYKERLHCGLHIYTAPAVAPPLQVAKRPICRMSDFVECLTELEPILNSL
jgi:hypothetical protein